MIDFFYNPWTIGIGVTVVGGLILYYIFGIGKTKRNSNDTRKAGGIDEGVGSTYINCEGIGPDAGLISKGSGLKSINGIQKKKFEERAQKYPDPRDSTR